MILNADIERVNPTTAVVRLAGRMTLGMRLREIEATISDLSDNGVQKLVVDLSGIEFADSAGLGFIMFLHGKMKTAGGQLRLVTPAPRLLEMFKMTHTDSILAIDPRSGAVRPAGQLPEALSDMGATSLAGRILAVGGRNSAGGVYDRALTLLPVAR